MPGTPRPEQAVHLCGPGPSAEEADEPQDPQNAEATGRTAKSMSGTTGPGEANAEGFSAEIADVERGQINTLQERLNEAEGQLVVVRGSLSRQAAITDWLCESDPELRAKINAFSAGWSRAKAKS